MYIAIASPVTSLNFRAKLNQQLWPHYQRRSMCTRIQPSSPPLTTTHCFLDSYGFDEAERIRRRLTLDLTRDKIHRSSGGVLTIERPKLDLSRKTKKRIATRRRLDHGGGDGGDIGGWNGNRGGPGDDDDDNMFDDDENEDEEEDFGLFRKRRLVGEMFDRVSIEAVLSEWMRTMTDLPRGMRLACEMGLLSSAEITRFLQLNTRPSFTRLFIRLLSRGLSLDFNAKMMADPALPGKLFWEAFSSVAWSVWLNLEHIDYSNSKVSDDYWPKLRERPLILLTNAVANAACKIFIVLSFAPSSHLLSLGNLPNNVFQKSNRFREFGAQKRLFSFRQVASLFALRFAIKAASQIRLPTHDHHDLTSSSTIRTKKTLSTMSKQALSAGLSLGLLKNLHYQLICGTDRILDLYFDSTQVALAFCFALRFLNAGVGISRSPNWVDSDVQN